MVAVSMSQSPGPTRLTSRAWVSFLLISASSLRRPIKLVDSAGGSPTRGVLESFDLARLDYYMKYHIRRPSRTHRDQIAHG